MSRAAKPKAVPMCVVTLDHVSYLMPLADGMKVVEIMQRAFECKTDYAAGYIYTPTSQPRAEMAIVRPDQVREPADPMRRDPKALSLNPSESLS